jgi:hypothetical protein
LDLFPVAADKIFTSSSLQDIYGPPPSYGESVKSASKSDFSLVVNLFAEIRTAPLQVSYPKGLYSV